MSYPFYRDLRDETQVFDGVFARFPTGIDLMIDGTPEQANAEIVTGSYFPVLGVRPCWDGSWTTPMTSSRTHIPSSWCPRRSGRTVSAAARTSSGRRLRSIVIR